MIEGLATELGTTRGLSRQALVNLRNSRGPRITVTYQVLPWVKIDVLRGFQRCFSSYPAQVLKPNPGERNCLVRLKSLEASHIYLHGCHLVLQTSTNDLPRPPGTVSLLFEMMVVCSIAVLGVRSWVRRGISHTRFLGFKKDEPLRLETEFECLKRPSWLIH